MTSNVALKIGSFEYDTTRALFDGSVTVEGADVTVDTAVTLPEIFDRMIRHREFDASELGMTFYLRNLDARSVVHRASGVPEPAVPPFGHLRQHC